MHVVMADDGIAFDGRTPERMPLGGAEGAFAALAEAFAQRGHRVLVRNKCDAPVTYKGVEWAPIADGLPARADLYIANRGNRLIGRVAAKRSVFWIHNPGRYLAKPRYVLALLRHRPVIVTLGAHHAATVPWWMPSGGRASIPYGLAEIFREAPGRRARRRRRAPFSPPTRCAGSTGSWRCGSGGSIRRCPGRSSISIAAPASMAQSAMPNPKP